MYIISPEGSKCDYKSFNIHRIIGVAQKCDVAGQYSVSSTI